MRQHIKFLGYLLLFSFIVSTSIFWYFEYGTNPNIKSPGDVLWWWAVTSSTVGYGDITPHSWQGRVAAVIAMIIGIYFYTNFVSITAEKVHEKLESHKRGTAKVNCKNHIVICEYTAIADELIQEIKNYEIFNGKEIVIVSDLVAKNPYHQHFFVSGVPINPASLQKANIEYADYVFVFSNARFREPDIKTLHIVSRVQKLNNKAKIFIELTHPESDIVNHMQTSYSNKLIPMDSDELLKNILLNNHLDLEKYIV